MSTIDRLERFTQSVEEQIEKYKSNDSLTDHHRDMVVDKLNFVLDRVKIFELEIGETK